MSYMVYHRVHLLDDILLNFCVKLDWEHIYKIICNLYFNYENKEHGEGVTVRDYAGVR
jgi:hypothetical protein